MKAKKRFFSLLLALCLVVGLLPTSALAAEGDTGVFNVTGGTLGKDYTYTAPTELEPKGGDTLTIKSNTPLTISTNSESGTTGGCRIVIEANVNANITLAGVNITPADAGTNDGYSGIDLGNNATLNITLQNDSSNVINGGTSTTGLPGPGIHVPENATLKIMGNGSLEVNGASCNSSGAVGIGGKRSDSEAGEGCGNVIILGGTIEVHGGAASVSRPPVDIGGGNSDTQKGGDCNTVIILTPVNSGGGLTIGGGKGLSLNNGSDGSGIKPTGDGTYTVYGNLELPCDITIPDGATVVIPEGASLTVPESTTLTNNGTILVQGGTFTENGTVNGNQPTYPSKVTVSFSQDGQAVTSVPYGSTVTITATMEKAETAANALSADPGKVDFYLGDANDTTGMKMGIGTVEFEGGAYTASVDVTIGQDKGFNNAGTFKFTADFGGYTPEGGESGDSLAPSTGSAELTVTKAEQTAPNGTFSTASSTENSVYVTFTDVTQSKNENGIEIAYAVGPTASEPTGDWTTATRNGTGPTYSVNIQSLSPGTPYIFFARYKGNDTHKPSPAFASNFARYTNPKILTQSLPNAYVGVEYSQELEAEAAEGVAVKWAIYSGSLPAGLTLNSAGTITGTPATPTTQAVSIAVTATAGEGTGSAISKQDLTISVTKSDAELGGLTVTGNTGINEGAFQYGDTITVTFTPERQADTGTNALAENTATLTYTPTGGAAVELATATAQADGSFKLTYDTKEKKLPIGENLSLTVSYGGSGALNSVEKELTVTLEQAILKNMPTVTGSFVYGETLTVNYTKQDDESVTYQWYRGGEKISDATENSYTLTAEDISKNIYVIVSATDEWHRGAMQSRQQEVAKAQGSIEIACDSVTYGETVQPTVTSNTNTDADVTYSYAGTGSTSYGPSSEAPENAGTYTVTATVAETATHTSAVSDPVAFTISKASLAAPQNLSLTSTAPDKATATWGTVENASGYTVQLYKDGKADGDPITTAGTSCEFSIAEAGSYTVKVKANGSDNYADSKESSPSAPLYFGTVTMDTDGNGTASASVTLAAEGTEITLTANADADSHFVDWKVVSGDITITGNKFTMPAENVEIKAVFEEHTYTDWEPDEDGTHSRACTICGDTQNGNCSGGEATCTKKAVCDACGAEYGEINAASHANLVKTEAKPATHMTEGNIEYWYCDGCEKYFSDEAGTKELDLADTVIPKLTEHTADGTGWHSDETNHWNTCECGEKLNEAAHTFEWVIDKEATAAETGSKHEKCTVCGYEKAAVEIPATGTPSGSDTSSPQTGDDSNIALWIAVLLAAGAALTGTAVYSRKRKCSR